MLSDFINHNFSLKDFYPGLDFKNKARLAEAWEWLGNIHCSFGAYESANKCFKDGLLTKKRLLSTVGLKYVIGAKKLDMIFRRPYLKLKIIVDKYSRISSLS